MGQPPFGWFFKNLGLFMGKNLPNTTSTGDRFPTPDRPLLHHWTTPPPDQRAAKEWNRCSKDFMESGGESNGPKVWPSKNPEVW